jgi:hypothetical protein
MRKIRKAVKTRKSKKSSKLEESFEFTFIERDCKKCGSQLAKNGRLYFCLDCGCIDNEDAI